MPKNARDGTETLAYSFRLNTGYAPRNYKKDLRAVTQPLRHHAAAAPSRSRCAITQLLLVVAGTADEAFYTEKYESVISQCAEVQVELLDGVTHMGAVVDPVVRPVVKAWLENPGE